MAVKCVLLGAFLLAPLAQAAAETLAVKTGAWEVTSTVHIDGPLLSPDAMARLPPSARAQVEGAMASMRQPKTRRTCLTKARLEHGFDLEGQHHRNCRPTVIRSTAAVLKLSASCDTSHGAMTENGLINAVNAETMTGHFDVLNAGSEGGPKNVPVDIAGHWVGECTAEDGAD